ncbi:putative secreted protein (Por secretion system target) [Arcicella aurantiaca]|uniref:Putative secreted protein (Por secretion system target) n=1 Tax=Arcicella aurantiaca TaxID=591202 RepID=A0A316DS07_9BACT|nr:M43 family zinc metalloprotease [Arcicella aurantiaca]PWK20242.1 putative secreted protein (Por secretion system target) [Arcicella aurantiaca]
MKKIFVLIFLFVATFSFAQERCGFGLNEKNKAKNPVWLRQKAEFEFQLRERQKEEKNANSRIQAKVYKIPVVVHVIHNNSASVIGGANNVNISDQQINSQIQVLNDDYRRKSGTNGYNTNPVGADMEIEFVLATTDPNGNPSTGITRTYTTQQSFDLFTENQSIANLIHWNYERYLNIWVVRSNGRTIGYSAFPYDSQLQGLEATASDIAGQNIFDGVIIDYRNFGTCCGTLSQTYNLGRTTTHEVGHWLGLLHTTADEPCGNDFCDDTPQIEALNLNTTCVSVSSTCNGVKRTNMIENYMDYSPDRCMNIFTNDQKTRTRLALELSLKRKRLLASLETLAETNNLTINVEPNPSKNNSFIKTQFTGQKDVSIVVYDFLGTLIYQESFANQKSNFFSIKNDYLKSGEYIVKVLAGSEIATQKIVVQK